MTDERTPDLIARAAARLHNAGHTQSTVERAVARAAQHPHDAEKVPEAAEPLRPGGQAQTDKSKLIAVDRGALARMGASVVDGSRTRTSEEFRIIKRHVVLGALREANIREGERSGRLIMVTSARPREGKTFTSVNLALSLASEKDYSVLLIDADAHRQSLCDFFGISSKVGWIDLLASDEINFADILLRTNIHNLTVLPAGRSGADVHELLSSKKMESLVTETTQRYSDRFIIFDAPPCLASSDPSVLAGLVGQVVFVVEANKTQREEIEASLRMISICPNINLLLNKVESRFLEEFGSYSEYYGPKAQQG